MFTKINKSILRDIFSFIDYRRVLLLSKGNKKLSDINNITIKTIQIVKGVIDYYKNLSKVSVCKIDSDNEKIINEYMGLYKNSQENDLQKRQQILEGLAPTIPTIEELNKKKEKDKEKFAEFLKLKYGKSQTEIRNIIFLTQLSLLQINNYVPLKSYIIYNPIMNELTKTILIPNNNSHIVVLGNSKGEIILINTNYINNYELLKLNTFKIKVHKSHITKIIQIYCLSKDSKHNITIASSSLDKTIKLFSLSLDNNLSEKSLSLITTLNNPKPVHTICEINNYSLASGTNEIIIWNLLDFRKHYTLEKHYGTVYSLYSIDGGNNIIVGSAQMTILSTKYNELRGMIYNNIDVPNYGIKTTFAVRDICKIKNGNIVICEDSHLTVYDFSDKSNEKRTILEISDMKLFKVIDIGNNQVLTCGEEGNIFIVDIEKKLIVGLINSIEIDMKILDVFVDDNGDLFYLAKGKCVKVFSFNNDNFKYFHDVDWEDYAYYSEDKINVFKRAFRINKEIKKNVTVEEGITNFKVET